MTRTWRVGVLVLALSCWSITGNGAGPITFDFESSILGTFTPFNQTAGGVTARFSVTTGPGYSIQNGANTLFVLSQFSGNFLYPNEATVAPLTILFSERVNSITLRFATVEQHIASSMHLNAYLGAAHVGLAVGPNAFIPGDTYPQGTVAFGGAEFDRVVLSVPLQGTEPAVAFLIDTIVINTVGPPPPVLTANWHFEENDGDTAADSVAGLAGRLGSIPGPDANDPFWLPGRTGSGLGFDGVQYVAVPDAPALSPATITVETWVRAYFDQLLHASVVAKGANATCIATSYGLRIGAMGGLEFAIGRPGGELVSPESPAIWNGLWHFVTGTFDGTTARIFIDGMEVGSGTSAGAPFAIDYTAPDQRLGFGSYLADGCGVGTRSFMGDVDQVGIWSGAMSGAAVAQRFADLNVPFVTTTSLTANPAGISTAGDPIELTAIVSSNNGVPGGSVEFFDGAASLGMTPLAGSLARITVTTLAVGDHTLSASFTPTGLFEPSASDPMPYMVRPVVLPDTEPPVVTLDAPATVEATGPGGAAVSYTATATDNQDPAPVVTCDPVSGAVFPLGVTTITCTARDASGNVSAPVTAMVTVQDTTPPALTLPVPVSVETADPLGTVVVYGAASATDLVDPAPVVDCLPPSGSHFAVGTTPVTCTARDAAGNTASGAFDVVVTLVDRTPPVVTLDAPATVEATGPGGAAVSYTATATDNQDPAPVVTCDPVSGGVFPLGVTTITCTARDASGNVSAPVTAMVTVQDTTPPTLTVPDRVSATASDPAGAIVTFMATASDLVDGPIAPACAPASGALFPPGVTQVTCAAADSRSNRAERSFAVTVTLVDTTPPVVTVPGPITAEAATAAGAAVTFSATAIDNVDGLLTPACTPASGSMFPLGPTQVTCSATDQSGNTGSASFTVLVRDTTPPAPPAWLPTTNVTAKTATLNWSEAADAVGVRHYRLYELVAKNPRSTWELVADGLAAPSYTPTRFKQPNALHTFVLVAVDAAGNESARSAELVVDLPKPPDLQ